MRKYFATKGQATPSMEGDGFQRTGQAASSRNRNATSSGSFENVTQHYQTLGVSPGASVDEIRKAYRKMALRYHPDKNPENVDTADFRRITDAYTMLIQ